MELRQLRYLLEIVRHGSFTAAARSLRVAQPALSVAVQRLEKELGVKLLDRSRRGVALTSEGRAFVERAQRIDDQVRDVELEMRELRGLTQGEVRIGIPAMLAVYAFPTVISTFRARHPGLRLSVHSDGAQRIQERVAAGELDAGIVARQGVLDSLVFRPLLGDEVVACVARGHALAQRRAIRVEDLATQPLLLFREGFFQRALLEELFATRKISPRVVFETNLVPLLVDAARRGEGMTTLLRMVAEAEPGLVALSFKPPLYVEAGIAWRAGAYLAGAARAFIDVVTSEFRQPSTSATPARVAQRACTVRHERRHPESNAFAAAATPGSSPQEGTRSGRP